MVWLSDDHPGMTLAVYPGCETTTIKKSTKTVIFFMMNPVDNNHENLEPSCMKEVDFGIVLEGKLKDGSRFFEFLGKYGWQNYTILISRSTLDPPKKATKLDLPARAGRLEN